MILHCTLDGLLLDAFLRPDSQTLIAVDGDEPFAMEAVEAMFYEVVGATRDELLGLERAGYRLLKVAMDFEMLGRDLTKSCSERHSENAAGSWAE